MGVKKLAGVCRDGWEVPSLETIREKLSSDSAWAERAIVVLFERQTTEEQECERTTKSNARGFNAFDAEILTSFAKQILYSSRQGLSVKQLNIAYKKLPKYCRQIQECIIEKHGGLV